MSNPLFGSDLRKRRSTPPVIFFHWRNSSTPVARRGFFGSAPAPVDNDQMGIDISHTFSRNDQLHGYYSIDQ